MDETTTTELNQKDDCVHKWSIDSPSGSLSVGVCRVCGIQREFKNSIEYSNWTSRGRVGRRGRAK